MKLPAKAENLLSKLNENTKLGELRKIAGDIKTNHALGNELWSRGNLRARLLALLIFDKKLLSQEKIDLLAEDMKQHNEDERNMLIDWLMANQLAKDKKTIALMESWEDNPSSLLRRIFWYYQGRLRWVGQTPPESNEDLVSRLEINMEHEAPEVQWAMNFTAGWIGVFDKKLRNRCVAVGEKTRLYKGKKVSKGCTPEYLPEFIAIESNKRNL